MSDNDKLLLSSLVAIIESLQAENAKLRTYRSETPHWRAKLIETNDGLIAQRDKLSIDLERVTNERDKLRAFAKAVDVSPPSDYKDTVCLMVEHGLWNNAGDQDATALLTGTEGEG